MKKIAIISTSYYPNIWNGQGRSTFNTAYGLSKKGYNVTVFTFANQQKSYRAKDEEIKVHYIGGLTSDAMTSLPFEKVGEWNEHVYSLLQTRNFDIIILNSWHGFEAAKRYGKAKIISFIPFLHNITGWLQPLEIAGLEEEIKKRELDCLLNSNVLVAHTERFAKRISVYADREVVIIPNCHLDISWPNDTKIDVVPNRLCFIGKVNREKNLERVIRILPDVPAAEFIVASPQSKQGYFIKLQNLAKEKDVEHRVKFVGWLDTKETKELYRSSALAIVPSQFESYGYGALDPMALGTPVLVSEWSCLDEYLDSKNMVFNSMMQLQEKISLALGVPADILLEDAKKNKLRIATALSEDNITAMLETLL